MTRKKPTVVLSERKKRVMYLRLFSPYSCRSLYATLFFQYCIGGLGIIVPMPK